MARTRLRVGEAWIDSVTLAEAVDAIERLVDGGRGGAVFTPNVDHVVNLERNARFRDAYQRADLSLADGTPIVWASRLLGSPLPERVSGADLVLPLMQRAAERRYRVYLLGAGPGVAEKAGQVLRQRHGVDVVGIDAPFIELGAVDEAVVSRIVAARPHLLLVALGAPKQELLIDHIRTRIAPTVALGIGASLDFIAGTVRRAPRWVSKAGLEWLFRLSQEPRRLWRRYLVDDPYFALILLRTLRLPREERVRTH